MDHIFIAQSTDKRMFMSLRADPVEAVDEMESRQQPAHYLDGIRRAFITLDQFWAITTPDEEKRQQRLRQLFDQAEPLAVPHG